MVDTVKLPEPGETEKALRPPGVRDELIQLCSAFSSLLSTRIELARLEYLEAHRLTMKKLALLAVAVAFLAMAFIAANVLLVARYWDTPNRFDVLGWMIGVYFVLGVIALWRLNAARRQAAKPFSATLAEFEKDRQWLATAVVPSHPSPQPAEAPGPKKE